MHAAPARVARLAASRHLLVTAIEAALPQVNATAETALAYVGISALWGLVLYLILTAIGT